jgi:hypothetical protein
LPSPSTIITGNYKAPWLRAAVHGAAEPYPWEKGESHYDRRRWSYLWLDFVCSGFFTPDEFEQLPALFVLEVGPEDRRGPIFDEQRRHQFKSWCWAIAKREDRIKKARARIAALRDSDRIDPAAEAAAIRRYCAMVERKERTGKGAEHRRELTRRKTARDREWRKKNPEKRRAQAQRHYQRKKLRAGK